MATRVILVRHGLSSYNAQKRIQGRIDDSVLTDIGRDAALQVGAALRSVPIDRIYCSPLKRARSTAETILSCLDRSTELHPRSDLMEIDLPLWEGMHRQEVQDTYPDAYRDWKEQPHKLLMELPDGRQHFPVLSLYDQAQAFWQAILPEHDGHTLLIVAHNGINRALLSTALGIAPEYYHSVLQSNCCINVLNFAGGWGSVVQLESLNLTAHLGVDLPSRKQGGQGPRLLLVRHGETEWNRQQRFQGQIDVPLNDNGQAQARKVAEFLKETPIDLIFSSPMLRPKQTAEAIGDYHPHVPLKLDDDLKEINHGMWEGKLESEIAQQYADDLNRWKTRPETVQMPAGENLQQVWERVARSWQQIVRVTAAAAQPNHLPPTAVVVAHDAVNKAILCQLFGLTPASFWCFKQGNGAVTVIDYPQDLRQPTLQAMNITTYLSGGIFDQTAAGAL